jgi:formiminoglutamate deiminase
MTRYHLELAALPDGVVHDVLVEVEGDRIVAVDPIDDDDGPADGSTRLSGITLPAFVDAHSHAFHRTLRFGAHGEGDDFWSWRDRMYRVAGRLDPAGYEELATAIYAEAALAGIGSIGEFHYLHHDPDGRPYDDPNAMAHALVGAAARAGVRLVLIDALYLRAGADGPLQDAQIRFGDGSAEAWADRVRRLAADLSTTPHATVAVAAHSVRAVSPGDLRVVVTLAHELDVPLHVHLSEQPAENRAALAETGLTPTALLDREGSGSDTKKGRGSGFHHRAKSDCP